ncbi:e3 ubiquitin-protein ligase rnf213 [Anaeramoeba ignava]|uniref:E3 ubiquitin-protein ligase rnf213 n=1 Tax=Anaeramoeba ignava TaxID=1746090 RepID=A0A9Q0R5A3_ANAIG|nr:e3 ubiquitin-protein ligase rnf213 [Anaeramoeba ignava]
MKPITFRIIRLFMNISILPVVIMSEKFSGYFIHLINNCVFKPKNQKELIAQLFSHVENDLMILSKLCNLPIYQATSYYLQTLSFLKKETIPKILFNKDNFGSKKARNEFENLFNQIYDQQHDNILKKIEENKGKVTKDLKVFNKMFNIFDLEKPNLYPLVDFFYKIKENQKQYPLIHFVIQNYKKLEMLNFFGEFLKFATLLMEKFDGKIKRNQAKSIKLKDLFKEKHSKNISKLFFNFSRFWKLASKEIKDLQFTKNISEEDVIFEITKESSIECCLPGNQGSSLMIEILIEHSIKIHNELIQSDLLSGIFKTTKENDEKKSESKFPDSKLIFPITRNFDESQFIKFDIQEFEQLISNNNNKSTFDLKFFQDEITEKLEFLKNPFIFTFQVNKFRFCDEKIESNTQFLEQKEWEQKDIQFLEWMKIQEEMKNKNLFETIKKLIEFVVLSCQKIDLAKAENLSDLTEKSIIEFVRNELSCDNYDILKEISPNFSQIAKLKHLLFINNYIQDDFESVLENLPKKFKSEMTQFQLNNLDKSIQNISIPSFLIIFKDFIKRMHENLVNTIPIRDLLLFSIGNQKPIYQEMDKFFDPSKTILLGNTYECYKYCLKILITKTNIF